MLTGCCQQAFCRRGQHFNGRGFSMMFSRSFAVHAGFSPLCRAQSWGIERLLSTASSSGDFRWMAVAFAVSALPALEAVVERQVMSLARHIMRRALKGARFAGSLRTADSMVAAGGH